MTAPSEERAGWTIEEAERLLLSLKGIVSARVVARPGGEVEEIHLLTTDEVTPKQTVRNVESALLAHLDLPVDHRKISVAQTRERQVPDLPPAVMLHPEPPAADRRIIFRSHRIESGQGHRIHHRVEVEWKDQRFTGEASAAELPRVRLEAVAAATLDAVNAALDAEMHEDAGDGVTLALDGVKLVDAFDRKFVLVAVHALEARNVTALAGATVVEESPDRAAILAALQATDRWVRGRV
jgi:hypothetical protein